MSLRSARLDRRTLLGLAVAASALAVVPLPASPTAAGVDLWRLATFRGLLQTRFRVRGGGSLRLVEVVDVSRPGDRGDAFRLVLEPSGVRTPIGLLHLTHPALGDVVLATSSTGRRGRVHAVVDRRTHPTRESR